MAEYTEDEIEELHDLLVRKTSEVFDTCPPDGKVPEHRIYEEVINQAFEQSSITHPLDRE